MSTTIILSYALIIVGIVVWALLIPGRRHVSPRLMNYINIFGGAFLFASCFINLVPHIFLGEDPYRFVTPNLHFKIAAAVMVGFLIQLLLEQLTHGAEHGHDHQSDETANDNGRPALVALLVGLCIHAFLEGMPMVDPDGDIHQGLLYGIVLHNIPIALVLVGLFMGQGYGFWRSFGLLLLFAVMTPLGSLCNLYLLPENEMLQSLIMGVVVGILLHVSVNILFDHHNAFSWGKLLLILAAFVAAYFTPGCPEIYSTF
jgi:zinc transporter ZupT